MHNDEEKWESILEKTICKLKKERNYSIGASFTRGNVENYLRYFQDERHPLYDAGKNVSEDDIVEIICILATTKFKKGEREYISNLKNKTIDKDWGLFHCIMGNDFQELNSDDKKYIAYVRNILDKVDEKGVLYYLDHLSEYFEGLAGETIETWAIFWRLQDIDIVNNLKQTTTLARLFDVQSSYQLGNEKYVQWSVRVFEEFMKNIGLSGLASDIITEIYEIVEAEIDAITIPSYTEEKLGRKLMLSDGRSVNPSVQKSVMRPELFSWYDTKQEIENVLCQDVQENKTAFYCSSAVAELMNIEKVSMDSMIRAFSDGKIQRANERQRQKLRYAEEFIKKWNRLYKESNIGSEKNYVTLYTVYAELLANDARPEGYKHSKRIVYDFLGPGDNLISLLSEEIFIRLKITRGSFRVLGLPEVYIRYIKLLQKYRKKLMDFFDIVDEHISYELIHKLNASVFEALLR